MNDEVKAEEKRKGFLLDALFELLKNMKDSELVLENVVIEADELELEPVVQGVLRAAEKARPPIAETVPVVKPRPTEILKEEFIPHLTEYPGSIVEVKLGATKSEGGSRSKSYVIGGEKAPAFYVFEYPMPHKPIVSVDVFDTKIPLAKAVKMYVKDVIGDPAEWARRCIDKFDAEIVNLHLVSIDPLLQDTSPREAAKTVEEVLQAVDVPLAVGGCGDPKKDLAVFEKVAEVSEGERILINSVTLDMDIKRSAELIKKYNHVVIAFTSMDMNLARELNRKLYEYLPKDQIVIDTTTAALGYGIDYAFTIMERTRLAGLLGDPELNHPMSSGTTNAWAAREAWMTLDPMWGPKELRGPIWEVVTALTLLLAGVDYFMMMHPDALKTVKGVIDRLYTGGMAESEKYLDWIAAKL